MKFLKILPLPLVVSTSCLLAVSVYSVNSHNKKAQSIEVIAEYKDHVDYDYIAFNSDNFKLEDGNLQLNVYKKSAAWPKYSELPPFGAIDDFLGPELDNGKMNDSTTGTVKSTTWTSKANTYISFTLGGGSNDNRVDLYKVGIDGSEDSLLKTFKPSDMGNTTPLMMPRMYKITETGDYYLKLVDNSTSDYGFVVFGGLCVNQSAEDVKQMIELWKLGRRWSNFNDNWFDNIDGKGYSNIFNQLNTNEEFKDARNATVSVNSFNEGFENPDWLLDWTLDYSYQNSTTECSSELGDSLCLNYSWSDARSNAEVHSDVNAKIPFNKTGDYFFKGYRESDNLGFIEGDQYKYRIISKAFVLSSDLISVKLSGNGAKLQLLDATPNSDSTLNVLAEIDNSQFNSSGETNNIALSGARTATMTRYIANVSAFKNKTVRLAMVDSKTNVGDDAAGGWQAINVDEIKTDYFDLSNFKFDVDTFIQTNDAVGTTYGQIPDVYVDLSSGTSLTDIQSAYEYLQKHYSVLRSASNGANFCNIKGNQEVKDLLAKFNDLSDEAAAIVNRSTDYNHGASATSENWYTNATNTFEVWRTIDYLMKETGTTNNHATTSFSNVLALNNDTNSFVVISVVVALFAVLAIGGIVAAKKRKNIVKKND